MGYYLIGQIYFTTDMMQMKREKLVEMKKKRRGQFCQAMVEQEMPESIMTLMKTALQAVQDQEIDDEEEDEFMTFEEDSINEISDN